MADIVVTASAVVAASTATSVAKTAGAAVAAGEPCYLDVADNNQAKPADANASSATATVAGIAMNTAADEQPVKLITEGDLTMNAVLTPGMWYALSANAGKICPIADLAAGHYSTLLGFAKSTTVLAVRIINSGVQV